MPKPMAALFKERMELVSQETLCFELGAAQMLSFPRDTTLPRRPSRRSGLLFSQFVLRKTNTINTAHPTSSPRGRAHLRWVLPVDAAKELPAPP